MTANTKTPTVWRSGNVVVSATTPIRALRSGNIRALRSGNIRSLSTVTVTPKETTVWS